MSAPLLPWAPPSVTELVVTWLTPLNGAGSVGAQRPSGAVVPYRMVTVVAGKDNKIMQCATVSVHTFADGMDDAEAQAQITHRRMLYLGPPVAAPQPVTLSSGQTVEITGICTAQIPIWVDYQDNTVFRFVARYEIDVRFM